MPATVLHFWQMILQCDVHLVVMLTDASTSAKTSSCIPYWPSKSGSTVEIGDFKIVNRFSSAESDSGNGSYVTSTLHMTHTPSKRQRQIWHLQVGALIVSKDGPKFVLRGCVNVASGGSRDEQMQEHNSPNLEHRL